MFFAARVAWLLMFAIFGVSASARASNGDDLNALLERMRARNGPVWRAHLISTSTLSLSGITGEMHSESSNLRFAAYQCADDLCAGTYFDGERSYEININGTTLPEAYASNTYLRGERTIASLAFLDPNFTSTGGRVADDGWATIAGTRYRKVLVSNGDAIPMHVFVDPVRYVVRYFGDVNGDGSVELRDYRNVDGGYYLPFEVLRDGKVSERYHTRGSTSDVFTAPHGPLPVFTGKSTPIATDPARAVPVFACTLGGISTTCLLDSGNSGLSISRELAQRLAAPRVGTYRIVGLGDYSTDVVRAGQLVVGNATFPAANYVELNDIAPFGYQVVLGADVFASTTISLDPVAHTIAFGEPAPSSAIGVHLAFQDFLPIVTVQLGTIGTQLALDTGDESNINLAFDFYQQHHDLFSATEQRSVRGVGGTSVEMIGTIPLVRIGDLFVDHQRIGATQTLHGTAFGHLGAQFLTNFNVMIDYATQSAFFTPIRN